MAFKRKVSFLVLRFGNLQKVSDSYRVNRDFRIDKV